MRSLVALLVLASVVAGFCADGIIAELTFPAGEVSSITVDKKPMETALDRGPHVIHLSPEKPATLEFIREARYPIEFDPPQVTDLALAAKGKGGIVPQTQRAFETTNTGWTITLEARPGPKMITLIGKASYTEVELVQSVHGEGAGPIMREFTDKRGKKQSEVISPNVGRSAVSKTTSSNFQVYATPGKVYKVPVRRGEKVVQLEVSCDLAK